MSQLRAGASRSRDSGASSTPQNEETLREMHEEGAPDSRESHPEQEEFGDAGPVPPSGNTSSTSTAEALSPNIMQYKKTASAATLHGLRYEYKMASLMFMLGVNKTAGFFMGTNVAGAGAFDDVVIKYKLKDAPEFRTLFIQLKHKEKSTSRISFDQLVKSSPDTETGAQVQDAIQYIYICIGKKRQHSTLYTYKNDAASTSLDHSASGDKKSSAKPDTDFTDVAASAPSAKSVSGERKSEDYDIYKYYKSWCEVAMNVRPKEIIIKDGAKEVEKLEGNEHEEEKQEGKTHDSKKQGGERNEIFDIDFSNCDFLLYTNGQIDRNLTNEVKQQAGITTIDCTTCKEIGEQLTNKKKARKQEKNKKKAGEQEKNKKKAGEQEQNKKKAGEQETNKKKAGEQEQNKKKAGEQETNKKKAGEQEKNKKKAGEQEQNKKKAGEQETNEEQAIEEVSNEEQARDKKTNRPLGSNKQSVLLDTKFEKIKKYCDTRKEIDDDLKDNLKNPGKNQKAKELIDVMANNSVEKFLQSLQWFTNQASQEHLDKHIEEEIKLALETNEKDTKEVAKKLIHGIKQWWDGPGPSDILTESAQLWTEILNWRLDLMNHEKRKEMEAVKDFSFTDQEIDSFIQSLSVSLVINVTSPHVKLSGLKMSQMLEKRHSNRFIFMQQDDFQQSSRKPEVLRAWQSERCDVLVIECSTDAKRLAEELKSLAVNKKLILISPQVEFAGYHEHEDEFQWSQLKATSHLWLLNKHVDFQGHNATLSSVIFDKEIKLALETDEEIAKKQNALLSFLTGDYVTKLLDPNFKLPIGNRLSENKHYFISRSLERQDYVKMDIFKMKHDADYFIISNAKEQSVTELKLTKLEEDFTDLYVHLYWTDHSFSADNFKTLCIDVGENMNIHWLAEDGVGVYWKQSFNNMSVIKQNLDTTKKRTLRAEDVNEGVVLVAADPGMGKSSLVTHLAQEAKKRDKSHWVIRISLNDAAKELSKPKHDYRIADKTVNFILSTQKMSDCKLGEEILRSRLSDQGKVIIFLDGFDEVYTEYNVKVIALINSLKLLKVTNIWLTSRSVIQSELESNLDSICYSITPFSNEDQQCFFEQYWSTTLGLESDILKEFAEKVLKLRREEEQQNLLEQYKENQMFGDSIMEKFAGDILERHKTGQHNVLETFKSTQKIILKEFAVKLLEQASKSLKDKDMEITGVPLQCLILAEACDDELRTYLDTTERPTDLPTLNLLYLYETFVEKKIDILYGEKRKIQVYISWNIKKILKEKLEIQASHIDAAMLLLFSHENWECFTNKKKDDIKKNVKKSFDESKGKEGFIGDMQDGKPRFIHRSFAEYFLALWLSENLPSIRAFMEQRLSDRGIANVWHFFDRLLAKDFKQGEANQTCPLHLAVLSADRKQVETLLTSDADLNQLDRGGRTALHLAACQHYSSSASDLDSGTTKPIIVQLLSKQRDIFTLEDGLLEWTALRYADKMQSWFCVEQLLRSGANSVDLEETRKIVDILKEEMQDLDEEKWKHKDIIQSIVGFGCVRTLECLADVCKLEIKKIPLLLHAAVRIKHEDSEGRIDVVKYLIDKAGAELNAKDDRERSALHMSASEGQTGVVECLIKAKANLNDKDDLGRTALFESASGGHIVVAKSLIEAGADISMEYEDGLTALYTYAALGNADVVKCIIDKIADDPSLIDLKNVWGLTALHMSSSGGFVDVVKCLIDAKADLNVQNEWGMTPLHLCASEGHTDVVQCLVDANADLNATDMFGRTALSISESEGHGGVSKCLVDAGANRSD